MIEPTVGRILWYIPHDADGGAPNGQPHGAFLAHVISERLVNLTVFNENGSVYAKTSVQLLQDDDIAPAEGNYAMWMPYQKGQAAKTDAVQAASPAISLQPVHDAIAALTSDIDDKFKSLGDWLNPRLAEIELKVNGSTTAPKEPPPAPAAADLSGAGADPNAPATA